MQRLGGAVGAASVSYSVTGGTATAADFSSGDGTLVFADGETSKTVSVPTTNDTIYEGTETIVLGLSAPTNGATIGSPASVTVTLNDEDPPPTVTLQSIAVGEGDAGTLIVQIPISLSGATAVPYALAYNVSSWNAAPGVDFIAGAVRPARLRRPHPHRQTLISSAGHAPRVRALPPRYTLRHGSRDLELSGVLEYWIIDPEAESAKIFRRAGNRFAAVPVSDVLTTPLLPSFQLRIRDLFA